MSKPLISIIIPIYKVEPYLRRCLDSVVNQTYTNLEIILIDDGSPDGCPQICDEYAAKDNRIVVIHKKNGGLSEARNTGLDICKGEYVTFIDSDDWAKKNYIETLLDIAAKENADIAIGENIKTDGIPQSQNKKNILKTFSPQKVLLELFKKGNVAFVVSWGKLYRKELFSSLRFPVGKYHEDEFTTYILFYNAKKTVYTSEVLYFYYQREGSIVSTRHPWDVLEYLEQRYLFFKERNESELLPFLLHPLCWQLLCAYWYQSSRNEDSCDKYLKMLRHYMNDLKQIKVPLFHYLSLTTFAHFPKLYLLYRKLSPLHIRKEF